MTGLQGYVMFKNQSIKFQIVISAIVSAVLLLFLGGLGINSAQNTQSVLAHFYGDFFRSINKLQIIEDLYDAVVRASVHRVLTNTSEPKEVIDVIEEGIAEAQVRWKDYMEAERATDGGRSLLNQEFENALGNVNIAWITLKALMAEKEPNLPKITAYVISDFYPKLDVLTRSYSHLLSRWMSQLDSDRVILLGRLAILWDLLYITIPLSVLIVGLLAYVTWFRLRTLLQQLVEQIDSIDAVKTDFTRRVVTQANAETVPVSLKFNHFMDHLLAVIRRVKISGLAVSNSMPQITQSSSDLSHRIVEFSSFTTEVGATAQEISVTSQELVKLMTDVSQTATNAAQLATSGQSELVRLETTMKQMEDASRQISKRLAVISEKAANITTVVTTINKFADQTNLLSLNASIEAEKAGEYGLGFAVVAREIRRLADQVALATYDIEQMVKEMKSAVSSGVMEMDKFSDEVRNDVRDVRNIGSQLAQIITHVQTLIPCFDSVHRAVQDQAEGAQQISDSMSQLNEAVEQASFSLKTASGTLGTVAEAAGDLQREIAAFVVDKG